MRRQEITAKRYARALFMLAREAGREEPVGQELQAASEMISARPELGAFLLRPWIQGGAKQSVIRSVAERMEYSRLVTDFLALLARRGRIDHLPEILRIYQRFADEAQGRARAAVRSAVALTDAERQALSERLSAAVGKQVLVEDRVDPTLLGGFIAQLDSLVLDGSLDGQLGRLRQRLARG